MTTGIPGNDVSAPSGAELSAQVARTRERLARTMARFGGTTDPAHPGHVVADVTHQARELAGQAASSVRDTVTHVIDAARAHAPEAREQLGGAAAKAHHTTAHLGRLVDEHTPPDLQRRAARAAALARANRRSLLLAAAAAVAGAVLLRSLRRRRGERP
ncbi:hypothetical protein ACIA8O_25215 [Kitasatospora sp. NPDC051853]|uniref:hypothetical protein n=1 Tax=Kitasatospora sp. NPDC051853 TaxID=3364058 RepID=UPI0037AC8C3A